MNPSEVLLLAVFALLALAALPLARLRRALLYLLHRGGHLALLAAVVACGVFAFRPDDAPGSVRDLMASFAPDGYPGVAWVAKAALLLLIALPLLAHLEYAREVATYAAYLSALRRRCPPPAANGTTTASAVPGPTRPYAAEVAAAVEAMRNSGGTARPSAVGPRKLVKDTLADNR